GFVGFERGDEACHDVDNVTAPFLLAVALQSGPAHVVLIGALLVGQMAELNGLYDAVDYHGRSEPRSKAQKEHLAPLVASQRLHSGIVDDLHGTTECLSKIEPDPSASQVVWFGNRPAVENRPGIADRDPLIRPPSGELLDSGHHQPGKLEELEDDEIQKKLKEEKEKIANIFKACLAINDERVRIRPRDVDNWRWNAPRFSNHPEGSVPL